MPDARLALTGRQRCHERSPAPRPRSSAVPQPRATGYDHQPVLNPPHCPLIQSTLLEFAYKDVVRESVESLAEVSVDSIHCSLFIQPALFSRQLIIQAQPAAEKFSLLRPELWCWKQMDVCAPLECTPSNECCERGDVVKPGMESLRHGRLISYPPSDEDSDDSEGENQELAQIDRERRRNCTLTPLATNQLQNQENQCCKVRALFHASLDRHSSEEELERINREFAAEKRKWSQVSRLTCCSDGNNTSSSDEEVKNLCAMSFRPVAEQANGLHTSPSPVLFSASPPKRLQPVVRSPASGPLILTSVGAGLEQVMPCKRHRQGYGDKVSRPSLDLEKMQQKMLLKKNYGAKTRVIQIRSINGGRPPPHFMYDPSTFAFRSLSTLKPLSPIAPVEEPSCAY
ncbi:hypothetical protein TURU_061816 [Turdus rufiventris]|nr:hypothetical protein TURU_061816 [Turdus rufiventris]